MGTATSLCAAGKAIGKGLYRSTLTITKVTDRRIHDVTT